MFSNTDWFARVKVVRSSLSLYLFYSRASSSSSNNQKTGKIGRWVLGGCRWDKCCCFLHYFKLTMVQKKEDEEVSLCPQSLQTQNTFGYRKHHKMGCSSPSILTLINPVVVHTTKGEQ